MMCLSCYRYDCEHIQNLRRLSEQAEHEGAVSGIIDDNPYKALPFFAPSPRPIPAEVYHNAPCPPLTAQTVQDAIQRLRETIAAPHGPACGCDDCEEERNR